MAFCLRMPTEYYSSNTRSRPGEKRMEPSRFENRIHDRYEVEMETKDPFFDRRFEKRLRWRVNYRGRE